ncbi:MAG TPA: four helix bundle protein [Rubricoccaceae bacterium]|nr:four helix bundle protein [Rubricoccaceae bacterium]
MRLRLKAFAVRIIRLVETLPRSLSGQTLGRQPLRSATSEAANYRAACRARSRAGFVAKMSIVVEEADETVFWLELLAEAGLIERQRIQNCSTKPGNSSS